MMRLHSLVFASVLALSTPALANPFGNGWVLEGDASSLQFQSIKNGSKIETSSFAKIEGSIDASGTAALKVLLDAVDTKVDLRNVRMRFLFFETFQYPEATVSAQITPDMIADLETVRRKTLRLPFTLELHGVTKTLEADLALTLIDDGLVAVSTAEPVTVSVADFNLMEGLRKLEEAANVTIVPSTSVSFDFLFRKSAEDAPVTNVALQTSETPPASAALETKGDFSLEACVGRFEILSRTGNIYFQPGSARLDNDSEPLLNTVLDIVTRCPDLTIQVAGHTDSVGRAVNNQRLSERRAAAVVEFLTRAGVDASRMVPVGFGEERPVADNATRDGRYRNRRIEFSVSNS